MLDGCYVESELEPHVALRERLLAGGMVAGDAAAFVSTGLLMHDYGEPLDDEAFLNLGASLGRLMHEDHPSVRPFVDRGVILNLVSEYAATDNVDLQPFATNFLTLHTESSGKPLAEQPRFILLMCIDPGDDGSVAETIVVPMDGVAERLGTHQLALLSQTRYRRNAPGATIVRRCNDRHVFAFRDFGRDELLWTYEGSDATADDINDAIRGLLAAMYTPESSAAVRWRRGRLVGIDNTFFFHGRTSGMSAQPRQRRHLKRLRILAETADGNW